MYKMKTKDKKDIIRMINEDKLTLNPIDQEKTEKQSEWIQVRLRRTTTMRLRTAGKMGESYDKVINRLVDLWEVEG